MACGRCSTRTARGSMAWTCKLYRKKGSTMAFDLVVRNGTVVDGSGLASYRADVGVQGGTITRVGRITTTGAREVDAEGCVVTPGFIDGHTHMDAQVMWDPFGTSSCWH